MPALYQTLRLLAFVLLLVVSAKTADAATELQQVDPERPQFRRPTAVERLDESTAVVANRCGTLTLVDLAEWSVIAEYHVGGQLTDLGIAGGKVIATDSQRSRLLVLDVSRKGAYVVNEIDVPTHPTAVLISPDETSCTVSSKWARLCTFISLGDAPKITATVELPFSPGEQLRIPDTDRLLVADAFQGHIALLDTSSYEVVTVHEFGASNIRGLAISRDGRELLIAHQILNDLALPRRSDIIWGVMVDNLVRTAKLDRILSPDSGALYSGRTISVGYAGQGAGDPDAMFVDPDGRTVIALAGVNEVFIGEPKSTAFRRIGVGRRPTALLPLSTGRFVVVNELSDSLSLIDTTIEIAEDDAPANGSDYSTTIEDPDIEQPSEAAASQTAGDRKYDKYLNDSAVSTYSRAYQDADVFAKHLSLGPTPEPGAAERGERLFFSARLSHASWFSCHSCHTDGHTNGGRSDTFGDDTAGAPKRVLSLLGVGETGPWGWNGKKLTLPAQVHQSAASTMRGTGVSDEAATDIAAFLKTLQPPPSYQPPTTPTDNALVDQGRQLFESLNCTDCHAGSTLTSADTYDVGLVDERGLKNFNPPSLRGVGYRRRLFHDKRAHSLEEVIVKFGHQIDRSLTDNERQALLRYLRSL
jgi:cytochrome c peroxidase/DNA-binding beta-propeller fold protein YncE